ncbi:MAG: DUF3341 domain-containing protein [Phycisphaerales bacterium]|jgi:hypothetical protein|nr:DUF3341 domain-containing protein [Phycisphaerales bacterium]
MNLPILPGQKRKLYTTPDGRTVHGVIAEFSDVPTVYHAAESVRDAGFKKWDVFSPFPIHGIEHAMGFKRTILPFIVAGAAFTGVLSAVLLQWFTGAFDYPLVVQGKPYGAWQPWLPVTFELGVLFSAFASLLGMLALNGLPRWHHPLMTKDRFLAVTDDKFIICIEARDEQFEPRRVREILERAGASHIELVEE